MGTALPKMHRGISPHTFCAGSQTYIPAGADRKATRKEKRYKKRLVSWVDERLAKGWMDKEAVGCRPTSVGVCWEEENKR